MYESNGSGFITGFLTGAALGALAALLLAPKPGHELRQELLQESGRLRERAAGTAREVKALGSQAVEVTRRTVREAAEGVKGASRKLRTSESRETAES